MLNKLSQNWGKGLRHNLSHAHKGNGWNSGANEESVTRRRSHCFQGHQFYLACSLCCLNYQGVRHMLKSLPSSSWISFPLWKLQRVWFYQDLYYVLCVGIDGAWFDSPFSSGCHPFQCFLQQLHSGCPCYLRWSKSHLTIKASKLGLYYGRDLKNKAEFHRKIAEETEKFGPFLKGNLHLCTTLECFTFVVMWSRFWLERIDLKRSNHGAKWRISFQPKGHILLRRLNLNDDCLF